MHSHVIGGTRTGKSKYLEHLMRQDVAECRSFALLDWHGTLYRDVLSHFASWWSEREIVCLNFAYPRFVTGLDFFASKGADLSTTVSRRLGCFIRPFGITNTNDMPTFERVMRGLFTIAAELGEPLPNVARLVQPSNHELRARVAGRIDDFEAQALLEEMQTWKAKEWDTHTLSSRNRLGRFLGSRTVRRFLGLRETLDLATAVQRGAIVLVNLGHSEYLSRESARIFAALFLTEFFEMAMRRAGTNDTYRLYLDEFQAYLTPDLGDMLDQVAKGGLELILAHQHLAQGLDPHLKESILTNARDRVVFGGLSYPTAAELVNELLLPDVNEREIKATYYRTREAHLPSYDFSESDTEGPDGYRSHTTSGRNTFVPQEVEELSNETDWSREEKVSRAAERLVRQPQRNCIRKHDLEPAETYIVPLLEHPGHSDEYLAQYEQWLQEQQGAIPAAEADRLLAESAREFLHRSPDEKPYRSSRKK